MVERVSYSGERAPYLAFALAAAAEKFKSLLPTP
jgi:hypothetical protein